MNLEARLRETRDLLRDVMERFHPRIALASSFGVEDVLLIHLLVEIEPRARVFTLDTGRLPEETYQVMDRVRERYGIRIDSFFPPTRDVEQMVAQHGFNLFCQSVDLRKLCCRVRKVLPLQRALAGLEAWVTGLRRDQAPSRRDLNFMEIDRDHGGMWKISPLLDWTWEEVWQFVRREHIPYNALHDRGYPSIGCAPCTRAIQPGEDPRAGRWWWEQDGAAKECGLHPVSRDSAAG